MKPEDLPAVDVRTARGPLDAMWRSIAQLLEEKRIDPRSPNRPDVSNWTLRSQAPDEDAPVGEDRTEEAQCEG